MDTKTIPFDDMKVGGLYRFPFIPAAPNQGLPNGGNRGCQYRLWNNIDGEDPFGEFDMQVQMMILRGERKSNVRYVYLGASDQYPGHSITFMFMGRGKFSRYPDENMYGFMHLNFMNGDIGWLDSSMLSLGVPRRVEVISELDNK